MGKFIKLLNSRYRLGCFRKPMAPPLDMIGKGWLLVVFIPKQNQYHQFEH